MNQQHCILLSAWEFGLGDGAGSKILLGVVVSFWAQIALPTSSSSVPLSAFWPSEAFSFVLVCRKHLILLLFCLYLQISFSCLPECPPLSSLTSQSSVKCSLPLTLATSSLSSLDSSSTCYLQHSVCTSHPAYAS